MGLMVIDGRVFVSFSFVVSLISIPHISLYINKLHPESDILIKANTSVSFLEYDIFDTGNCDNDRHLPKTKWVHRYNPFCFSFGHSATLHIMVIQE